MGVPGVLCRAMFRPGTTLEEWAIDGVSGICPTARQGWTLDIIQARRGSV